MTTYKSNFYINFNSIFSAKQFYYNINELKEWICQYIKCPQAAPNSTTYELQLQILK